VDAPKRNTYNSISEIMQQKNNTGIIVGIIVLTVLIFAGLAWAISKAPSGGPGGGDGNGSVSFNDANDPFKGPVDAPVVVRIYGDLQCPACKMAETAVKYAIQTYGDRVKFVWKDFPLTTIHPNARPAANAARCAEEQGKFWEYHDELYRLQTDWERERNPEAKFVAYAETVGLNKDAFTSCYRDRRYDGKVAAGMGEGLGNRVDRTPTFFVNDRRYYTMSPAEWDEAIRSALAAVTPVNSTSTSTSTQ
jgi:protein-disulfide isomerase